MEKLLIIGTLPKNSGIGGVTIHISRLLKLLDEKNIGYLFVDYRIESIFTILRLILKSHIVHLHATNSLFKFLCALCCRIFRKKIVITFHGNIGSYKNINRLLNLLTIRIISVPVFINANSMEIGKKKNKNSKLFSAFIPPSDMDILDDEILNLVYELKKRYKFLFSANAYNYVLNENGNEIYGITFLLSIFKEFQTEYALLISDPSGGYKAHFLAKNIFLPPNVKLISHPHSFYQLLKYVDVFLRPTSTDGDSLSVKEALFLGKPVVCSDVVDRPLGTIVYHEGSEADFKRQITRSLSLKHKNCIQFQNGGEQLIELYKSLGI